MKKVLHLFIVNPAAGKGREQRSLPARILSAAEKLGVRAEVFVQGAAGEGKKKIRELAAKWEQLRVYACGGDGTVNEVINGAWDLENVSVGVYPCGSGNDFVKSLPNTEKYADITALMQGGVQNMDLLDVNGRKCCNMTNLGFDALVAYRMLLFKRIPLVSGPLAYSLAVAAGLLSRMSYGIRAVVDGTQTISGKFMLCAVGSGQVCGGKYYALPRAKPDDGLLDACFLRQVPRRKFPSLIGVYKAGDHLEDARVSNVVTYRQCTTLTVETDRPAYLAVDGEITRGTSFTYRLLPGALRMIIPE